MVLGGSLIACAMYSYPPAALHAPVVILLVIGYQVKQKKIPLAPLGLFLIVLGLLCAPLVYYTLKGGPFVKHFNDKFIAFKSASPIDCIMVFIRNYFAHLNPRFLFLTGDNIYRYSTRHFGILSWLDVLGLGAGLVLLINSLKKRKKTPNDLAVFLLMAAALASSLRHLLQIPSLMRRVLLGRSLL